MSNKKYCSIMIDIVDSRKYKNRNEIQEFMKCIIVYLNKIFYKSLKKPLMFSAGDDIHYLFMFVIYEFNNHIIQYGFNINFSDINISETNWRIDFIGL